MEPRRDPFAGAPQPKTNWLAFGQHVQRRGLDKSLMERVNVRSSQLNRFAFCLHMHTAGAGETERRLYLLHGWRESPLFAANRRTPA